MTCTQDPAKTIQACILGLAVGDALGVPVEFQRREELDKNPVTGLRSGGVHGQPVGTWSDDTSLTLCLVESLCEAGIDYEDQARRFVRWLDEAHWTAHGDVFDVGNATRQAIGRLRQGQNPLESGGSDEWSCGNGSLMRILPLAMYLAAKDPVERIVIARDSSRLTHGHVRCQLACAWLVEIGAEMIHGATLAEAASTARDRMAVRIENELPQEAEPFARLLSGEIASLDRTQISSSGYVIHCLEASLWCALRAEDYASGVLAAVNLGDDTDTTAAVTGGLLGLRFGLAGIPDLWLESLARREEIAHLSETFAKACLIEWGRN